MLIPRSQVAITPDDQSSVVGIVSIISICFAAVSCLARLFTKLNVVQKFAHDDYVFLVAFVLAAGQTAMMVIAAQNGLGRRLPIVTPSQQDLLDKTAFGADIIFIATTVLVKVSVALFLTIIAPFPIQRRIARGYIGVTALWGVISIFVAAFICKPGVSALLESSTCFDSAKRFWNSFDVLNLLFETFLIAWPSWTFGRIQAGLKQRVAVIAWFCTRITTVSAIMTQLVYLNRLSANDDPTFNMWRVAVCTQAVQALGLITACIPTLRPFLDSINSGLTRSDMAHRQEHTNGMYFSYNNSNGGNFQGSMDTSKPISGSRWRNKLGFGQQVSLEAGNEEMEPQASLILQSVSRSTSNAEPEPEPHDDRA